MILEAGALVRYWATSTVSLKVQPLSGEFGPACPGMFEKTESYAMMKNASTTGARSPILKIPPSQLAAPAYVSMLTSD